MLTLKNIVKQYENVVAVDHINLSIPRQSIFGLLGPNGAGKTTTIRMINQIIGMDEGEILFNSEKIQQKHTENIGYMPEERGLYSQMKVGEHLLFLAELKGLRKREAKEKINYWITKFSITDWWNKKIIELSKGMQQKIQFIATVLHSPTLLIFDEPFTGLDPINTKLIKKEIRTLQEEGATIIFSTHRMEQVEEICEQIALINKGKIILQGNLSELKQTFKKNHYQITYQGKCNAEIPFSIVEENDHQKIIEIRDGEDSNTILRFFLKHVEVTSFHEILPSLNEIFIEQVSGVSHE